jgi:hypothetical protein
MPRFDLVERIYDPEMGEGVSSTRYIYEHYYKSKNPEDYFISFTAIDKLGINPQSKYNTPIGIYTYPVKEFFDQYVGSVGKKGFNKKIGSFAPFAGEHPWVWVVEINRNEGKIFDIAEYSERDFEDDIEFLSTEMYRFVIKNMDSTQEDRLAYIALTNHIVDGNLSNTEIKGLIGRDEDIRKKVLTIYFQEIGEQSDFQSPAGRMWNTTRIAAKKDPVKWNKLFREMGYICAIDRKGEGVIHESERVQAVFFQRKYFDVVDKVENIQASLDPEIVNKFNEDYYENYLRPRINEMWDAYFGSADGSQLYRDLKEILIDDVAQYTLDMNVEDVAMKVVNIMSGELIEVADDDEELLYRIQGKLQQTMEIIDDRGYPRFAEEFGKYWNYQWHSAPQLQINF